MSQDPQRENLFLNVVNLEEEPVPELTTLRDSFTQSISNQRDESTVIHTAQQRAYTLGELKTEYDESVLDSKVQEMKDLLNQYYSIQFTGTTPSIHDFSKKKFVKLLCTELFRPALYVNEKKSTHVVLGPLCARKNESVVEILNMIINDEIVTKVEIEHYLKQNMKFWRDEIKRIGKDRYTGTEQDLTTRKTQLKTLNLRGIVGNNGKYMRIGWVDFENFFSACIPMMPSNIIKSLIMTGIIEMDLKKIEKKVFQIYNAVRKDEISKGHIKTKRKRKNTSPEPEEKKEGKEEISIKTEVQGMFKINKGKVLNRFSENEDKFCISVLAGGALDYTIKRRKLTQYKGCYDVTGKYRREQFKSEYNLEFSDEFRMEFIIPPKFAENSTYESLTAFETGEFLDFKFDLSQRE